MNIKRFLIIFFRIFLSTSVVFAQTYRSPSYILEKAKIVVSSGKASSPNYSIDNVEIGSVFGGTAESTNYSLDVSFSLEIKPPNPPTLDPITSPTNISIQTATGTKESNTSIYINGYEKVSLDSQTTWNCEIDLIEDTNHLVITSRNKYGLESESVYIAIILDTIPPTGTISINNDVPNTRFREVTLNLSATDSGTEVVQMQFSNNNTAWSAEENYSISKNWLLTEGEGTKTVYVKFKDRAENWSFPINDTITHDNTVEKIYIYLNGKRIAMENDDGKFFFHPDHLGGANVITDESGSQVKYLDYYPFGSTKTEEGDLVVNKRYTGKELDDSTELYNYEARLYDPEIAVFIMPDEKGVDLRNPQTLNRYAYCLNNPLKYVDPTGNEAIIASLLLPVLIIAAATYGLYLVSKGVSSSAMQKPVINSQFRRSGRRKPLAQLEQTSYSKQGYKPQLLTSGDKAGLSPKNQDIESLTNENVLKASSRAPTPSGIWPPTPRDLGITEPGDPAQWPKFPPGWKPPWWVRTLIGMRIAQQVLEPFINKKDASYSFGQKTEKSPGKTKKNKKIRSYILYRGPN